MHKFKFENFKLGRKIQKIKKKIVDVFVCLFFSSALTFVRFSRSCSRWRCKDIVYISLLADYLQCNVDYLYEFNKIFNLPLEFTKCFSFFLLFPPTKLQFRLELELSSLLRFIQICFFHSCFLPKNLSLSSRSIRSSTRRFFFSTSGSFSRAASSTLFILAISVAHLCHSLNNRKKISRYSKGVKSTKKHSGQRAIAQFCFCVCLFVCLFVFFTRQRVDPGTIVRPCGILR